MYALVSMGGSFTPLAHQIDDYSSSRESHNPPPSPAHSFARVQRQQFDLPQPILSLGGRATIVLSGMAQRQTLHPTMGETANHYHICISYAALVGNVLLCSIADRATDGPTSQSWSSTDATAVINKATQENFVGKIGSGGSLAEEVRPTRGVGKKQHPGVRLRWVLDVLVHRMAPEKRGTTGDTPDFGNAPLKIMSYSDTPCLEFLERYGRHHAPNRAGDVQLLLAGDSGGRALTAADGAVLGIFPRRVGSSSWTRRTTIARGRQYFCWVSRNNRDIVRLGSGKGVMGLPRSHSPVSGRRAALLIIVTGTGTSTSTHPQRRRQRGRRH